MDFRQNRAWSRYLSTCGWNTEPLNKRAFAYVWRVPLLGPVIRIPRIELPIPLSTIERVAAKTKSVFVKLEPNAPASDISLFHKLARNGYHMDHWAIEPTATLVIDVTKPEDLLFGECKPKWRQYIRYGQRHGVSISHANDIALFYALWHQNSRRKGFRIESKAQLFALWRAFRRDGKAHLLFASVESTPVASALLLVSGQTMFLYHLGYSGTYEGLRPLYCLVWETIRFAKSLGCTTFDFDGIADDRFPYTAALQPTFFKLGFGGSPQYYLGSFIKYYRPIRALPYKLLGRIKPEIFFPLYRILSTRP